MHKGPVVTLVGLILAGFAPVLALVPASNEDAPPGRLHWLDARPSAPSPEVTPEFLELGRKLYETRCSICHGKYGEGDGIAAAYLQVPPRDFSYGVFKFRTVRYGTFPLDEDLFRTVTAGFPAYGMPSYEYLSEEERWSLVAYVKELAREGFRLTLEWELYEDLSYDPEDPELTADEQTELEEELAEIDADIEETLALWFEVGQPIDLGTPVEATPELVARGKELFFGEFDCKNCHGDTGRGDGPSVNDEMLDDWGNPIRPRDYQAGAWYFKVGNRPHDIVRTLRCGIPGSPMPAYREDADDLTDLWAVAHFVRSLADESNGEGR